MTDGPVHPRADLLAALAGGRPGARMLDALAEAVTVTQADGRLVFANAAALERMGIASLQEAVRLSPAELLGRFELTSEDGLPVRAQDLPGRRLLRGEPAEPVLLRMVERATGRVSWTLVKATVVELEEHEPLALNVLEDVTEARERELREHFLAQAGEALAGSLDYEETLQRVAQLAVPGLADWCGVEILDEAGQLRQVAVAHVEPAKVALARELRHRYPPRLDDPTGAGAVARTGRAELYPAISDQLLRAGARDEEQLRLARELGLRSAVVVPMRARGQILGAITLVAAESGAPFDADDLAFAEGFASRAALAVDNARLYRRQVETATTLQRRLLPPQLPAVAGWALGARYRPAGHGEQIGGDFYDLYETEAGLVVLIGDVTGRGLEAAALTALTRHTARAGAALGLAPGAILGLLNRLLLERQEEFAPVTAVVAVLSEQPPGASLTLASAGHPLPLYRRPGSSPEEVGRPGPLLGYLPEAGWPEVSIGVEPDTGLFFYTDGVTDTRGRHDRFGERRLHRLLREEPIDPQQTLEAIERALSAFQDQEASDDMAMLALHRLPRPAGSEPLVGASARSGAVEPQLTQQS